MAGPAAIDEAEIAVVGAGPAGCTTAAFLAERGHDVLLLDKDEFPREKPCGDGLAHPAVAAAQRLGLGALIEANPEIATTRVVMGHRRQTAIDFVKAAGRPLPRCIAREEFDAALLGAARERGARFRRARVDSFVAGAGAQLLRAEDGEGPVEVRAATVVAADGATSRIRRLTREGTDKPTAYAIRQYFRCELALDPVFHIDVPLEFEGRILYGYGWVFPLDEHTANVGIGLAREPHRRVPSLRAVLDSYLAELGTKSGRRFGDLEPIAEPIGSPVSIRPQIALAGIPGLTLVGDAAGTVHPVTGEGISFAMRAGEELAAALHARSRRSKRPPPPGAADSEVWRSFPQVGIDASIVVRSAMQKLNQSPSAAESVRSVTEPFLRTVWRIAPESAYETGVAGTPAWAALAASDPELGRALERSNDLLLERLSHRMPFVTEVIHGSIKAHLGPIYAALVLATSGAGPVPEAAYEAGVSAETVGVLPKLLSMLVDRARSKQLKVNNALAVLTGDFAATRSLSAAARLGPEAVTALSRACMGGCVGGMRDASARFAADRTAASWLQAARETEGAAAVLATEFGALVRGEEVAAAAPLRQFGLELGVAIRLAEEIVDLTVGDGLHPGEEGSDLGLGIYPLPLLYAIEAEPALPRLLAQHGAGHNGAAEVIAVVRECGALDRAIAECANRAAAARAMAAAWEGGDGSALQALAAAPAGYVAARLPAAAPGAC